MCHQPASCLCKGQHRSAEKPGLCSFSKFLPFYCSRRSRGPGLMFSTGITNHRNKHKRNALWGPYGVDIFNLFTLGQVFSVSLSLVARNIVPLGSQQMPRTFIFMTVIKLDRNKQNGLIAETAYQNPRYSSGIWELRSLHICFKVSPRLCTVMCLHHPFSRGHQDLGWYSSQHSGSRSVSGGPVYRSNTNNNKWQSNSWPGTISGVFSDNDLIQPLQWDFPNHGPRAVTK